MNRAINKQISSGNHKQNDTDNDAHVGSGNDNYNYKSHDADHGQSTYQYNDHPYIRNKRNNNTNMNLVTYIDTCNDTSTSRYILNEHNKYN